MKPPKTSPAPKKAGTTQAGSETPVKKVQSSARSEQVLKEVSMRRSDALARLAKR